MNHFRDVNPVVMAVYWLCFSLVPMLTLNPILLAIGALAAVLQVTVLLKSGKRGLSGTAVLVLGFALLTPLFSRSGQTVLLLVADRPITLEALLYAVAAASALGTVLLLFRLFSTYMTCDRLLYVFGFLSKRLALLLSLTIRSVTLTERQYRAIRTAQKALGREGEASIFATIRASAHAFSILMTWILENGIITADSMDARGYGTGKRSAYRPFRFTPRDGIALGIVLTLTALPLLAILTGIVEVVYYPLITQIPTTPLALASYLAYASLGILPLILCFTESRTWKSFASTT